MEFDVVIGLEIHAELKTKTKVFCHCKNEFGAAPNANTCPVCTGMPGALPLINKKAVELCVKAGLCFGCDIADYATMERKQYFYPDLSKAYQISQLVHPICVGGQIALANGAVKRLNRIHLEEDAGKLIHISKSGGTLVDYNRGGTPLIEMVTEPDFTSAAEVDEFLKRVREALVFADIADCKMEEGGMRCDVNLSLKPKGSDVLGTRTEMKNLNSFKSVTRAIEYEIQRQKEILISGGKIIQETRKWDDAKGKNLSMRSKEEAQDYRYFPDPDILPISIPNEYVGKLRQQMPLLPEERRDIYVKEYGLPEYDSKILTSSKYISDYYDNCVKLYYLPKKISNWIMVDLLKRVTEEGAFEISEEDLTTIIKMVEEKKITKAVGVELLDDVITSGKKPEEIAKDKGLLVSISKEEILSHLQTLKETNAKVCADYTADPAKVMGFIVGYVMKCTGGKANSALVKELIPTIFG